MIRVFTAVFIILATIGSASVRGQISGLKIENDQLVRGVTTPSGVVVVAGDVPLMSYQIDESAFNTIQGSKKIKMSIKRAPLTDSAIRLDILFHNIADDTLSLSNVHPFDSVHVSARITGKGKHPLSRAHLFMPGRSPVNVIVPDNAWELGYASLAVGKSNQVAALTRRERASITNGQAKRFETVLYPGGSVRYTFFAVLSGESWQEALRSVFQDRMLFDVRNFDDQLFQREDLKWIRHTYVQHLMYAWDKHYYDYKKDGYQLQEFLKRGKEWYGGDDVVSIWPTWPTLGLDQRNQFDLFRDLPGGIQAMKEQAEMSRKLGTRFFICYNPWDESTRQEDHFQGLSQLISETSADGVVLDTRGGSSSELQEAADRVRLGVVMYSEGMAVPADMQGIVSGRVHNALYYPPMLNLNKLIRPEFAIYRVAEIFKEPIRREFNLSFFNGYGTELNIMAPGEPSWAEEQYRYLGRTSRILRENTHNFVSRGYTPLIETTRDSIWVNEWKETNKTIYTIYSVLPQGFRGNLFPVNAEKGFHFVDLWNHEQVLPEMEQGQAWIPAQLDGFPVSDLGTNNEGAVNCIARLPRILSVEHYGDELVIKLPDNTPQGELRVWAGNPKYGIKPVVLPVADTTIRISRHFDRYEGKVVLQLMQDGILHDEQVVYIQPGTPRRISQSRKTPLVRKGPREMVTIPSGRFLFKVSNGDQFIPYPKQDVDSNFVMTSYFMDRFPVTNQDFSNFIKATGYKPADTANFLKHWVDGNVPPGQEKFPVVYVSYEDAAAYANWAGKRLPTEIEWQYAAQTADLREWPWNQRTPVKRTPQVINSTLTVTQLTGIDSSYCNLGDGEPYAVGSYPKGVNPFGLHDLVGSVWQLTNDLYMNGSHRYIILKGGSYFKPSASWWYVQGGPRELHYRQQLLRVSPGFERNATVGFRCVKDMKP